ncbi:hypothetical protein [Bradyrhizobium sp. 142]|uniref:hypothetical protein n=1 Tax=Bradyrhizobium sp. 142 TaxID=2782618 RepID=UPI001FF7258D|nr:hypothetical protein [Bradyrhizobium sp. 142]MCK1728261.1 hypothetical protein [Bradyrhizobium sp. 142]
MNGPTTTFCKAGEGRSGFEIAAVERHVSLLHELASDLTGKLVVCIFHEGQPGTITHHRVGDVDGTIAAIMAHANTPGANVYMPLCVMRADLPRGKKGTEADIVAVLALVAPTQARSVKCRSSQAM